MATLAGMTVVVESASRSGSLITTDLAADLGRVPGPVTSRASAGPNSLLAALELLGYLACSSLGNYSSSLLRSKL